MAPGDRVYLDPPYLGCFDAYSPEGFDVKQHVLLEETAHRHSARARVVASLPETPEIRAIWCPWELSEVAVSRGIGDAATEIVACLGPRKD